jgi:hypothetical protein
MQDLNFREEMLQESFNYKGDWFWENYILSNIVKNLPYEIKTFGNKVVVEAYTEMFGDAGKELYEYLVNQDIETLKEASEMKSSLLFEGYADKEIKVYLNEKFPYPDVKFGPAPLHWSVMKESPTAQALRDSLAGQYKFGNMLTGAWEKLKALGRAVFAPILPYLKQGFAWAKGMAQQGIAWFNKTPWAKAMLPLLLITGGVLAAKKLINKIRKRKMSPQEEEALKAYAMKNNARINELRKKANQSPIKV